MRKWTKRNEQHFSPKKGVRAVAHFKFKMKSFICKSRYLIEDIEENVYFLSLTFSEGPSSEFLVKVVRHFVSITADKCIESAKMFLFQNQHHMTVGRLRSLVCLKRVTNMNENDRTGNLNGEG